MAMKITECRSVNDNSVYMQFSDILDRHAPELILREIAHAVAERFVADHYQEIVAAMDMNAIATLSVAEAAAKIRETLEKKIPDKILEVQTTKKEVWQRGIFGGMSKIG
jgi:hypothetical protein